MGINDPRSIHPGRYLRFNERIWTDKKFIIGWTESVRLRNDTKRWGAKDSTLLCRQSHGQDECYLLGCQ